MYSVHLAGVRLSDPYDPYDQPGYRQIVDLADLAVARFILPTGQSGKVLSPHYDDFIARHRDVAFIPMTFGRTGVDGAVLTLRPE